MATSPAFATTPRIGLAKIIEADTAIDNPSTNVYTVLTAGSSGTRVDRILLRHNGDTAAPSVASVLRLWIHDGTSNRLYKSFALVASTPTNTAAGYETEIGTPNLVLPTTYSLRATMSINTAVKDYYTVTALGADL
jgi:hypothetical protein